MPGTACRAPSTTSPTGRTLSRSCGAKDPYHDAPRPDLILLDLNLPRVDGRQVLHEIKTDDGLKPIPTIVFTTSSSMDDISSSYTAHANAYVTKPLDLDAYERVVTEIRSFFGHTASLPRHVSDESAR